MTFILATDPGTKHKGTVREIDLAAEVEGEEGNTVQIKVGFDKAELLAALGADASGEVPHMRPGAEVSAKVDCGSRSIGYVWFHDLIEFVQAKILFRL